MSAPLYPHEVHEYYARRAARKRGAWIRRFWSRIATIFVVLVIILVKAIWSSHHIAAVQASPEAQAIEDSVYYPNCTAAYAVGAAPIDVGQPGYRTDLDGDGDGVACEPYHLR